jgi:hypothetical protein
MLILIALLTKVLKVLVIIVVYISSSLTFSFKPYLNIVNVPYRQAADTGEPRNFAKTTLKPTLL